MSVTVTSTSHTQFWGQGPIKSTWSLFLMKPEPPEPPPSWAELKFHLLMPELQKCLGDFAYFQTHSLYFHLQSLRQKGKRTFSLIKPIFPSIQLKQHRFLLLICNNDKLKEISFKLSAFMAYHTSKDGKSSQYFYHKALSSYSQTLNSHLLTIYTDLGFKIVLLPLLPVFLTLPGTSEGLCPTKL